MNLLIQDKNDTVLPLFNEENFFKINGIPHNIRSNKLERYQQSGSVLQGDLKSPSRDIQFNFNILAETDPDFRYGLNKIASFFKKSNRPFYLVDTENQIRTEVYRAGLEPNWQPGLAYRVSDCVLRMDMLDATWEDIIETSKTQTLQPNDLMTIQINPICEECFFEVTFEGMQPNTRFAFNNLSNGGSFLCEKAEFDDGDLIVVDGRGKGSVTYNSVTEKRIITGGIYFPLSPGENQLQYQSNFGEIQATVKYRQRYLY